MSKSAGGRASAKAAAAGGRAAEEPPLTLDEHVCALLPYPCFFVEPDGTIRRANAPAADLLRTDRDSIVGRDLRTYIASEDRAAFVAFLQEESSRGGGGSIETTLYVGAGAQLPVRFDSRSLQDYPAIHLFVRELSTERRLERSLTRSEERCLALSRALRERVVSLDDQDRITYVNRALSLELDRQPGQLIGRHFSEVAFSANGAAVDIPRSGGIRDLRIKSGREESLPVRFLFSPIEDRSGRYLGAVATDAAERFFSSEALRESRHFLHLLFEAAPIGIFRTDADGDYIFVNGRWMAFTGLSSHEAMGQGWLSSVHQGDRDFVAAEWRACAVEGRSFRLEYRLGKAGDRSFWVLGQALPDRDQEGALLGFVGTLQDISERKRAEDELLSQGAKIESIVRDRISALEEARKRTALLLDSLEEGVCEVNPRGRIDFANPAAARLLGFRAEALRGTHFHAIVRHDGPGGTPCPPGACPLCDAQRLGEARDEAGAIFIRADGSQFDAELVSSPMLSESRLIGTVVVFRDVTKRRQEVQARIASELRYKSLFDNLPIPVFVIDFTNVLERFAALKAADVHDVRDYFEARPDELNACLESIQIIEVNQASVPFFGVESKGEVPLRFASLFTAEHRRAVARDLALLAQGSNSLSDEIRLGGSAGEERELIFWLSSDPGQAMPLSRALVSFIDVTDARAAEREAKRQQQLLFQSEKMASLGILVTGMAHEINTPNHTIRLNANLLARVWESARPILDEALADNEDALLGGLEYAELRTEMPRLLRSLHDAAEHIDSIVRGLKDFSRLEEDEAREEVRLNLVVTAAVTLLQSFIDRSTERFRLELATTLPCVRASFHRLEQVVVNLVQNACQALESPGRAIVVTTEYDEASNLVRLVVRDEGRGMTVKELQHMRDPFFTTKRGQGGLGLGVPISVSIVEEFGGSLEFESAPGQGTRAVVELPASPAEEETAQ